MSGGENMTEYQGSSADANINLGPAKAIAALVATPVVAFLSALGVALQTGNVVDGGEWVTIAIATIVSTGLVGGATYAVPAKVTVDVPVARAEVTPPADSYGTGTGAYG